MAERYDLVPTHRTVSGSVGLHAVCTERFKTARLSLFMSERAARDTSPVGTLLMGVLQRGCEGYPSLFELNRGLDWLYGASLSVRNFLQGDNQVIGFTADLLDDRFVPPHQPAPDILGSTLEIISRMWLRPLLDEKGMLRADVVESEKRNLCDTILSDRKDPRTYASNYLRYVQCEGEPYGLSLMGTVDQIRSLTAEDVTREWKRRVEESHADVFYIGAEPADRLCEKWEKAFAHWHPVRPSMCMTRPHARPAECRRIEEAWPVTQGRLHIGWQSGVASLCRETDQRMYDAAMVLAELFGVMQGNLLFANLRERLGLCYECDATWESSKGVFTVSMGIASDCRDEAEREVFRLMEEIQAGQVEDRLVELAKLSLSNGYRQIKDHAGAMEAFWFRRLSWLDDTDTPDVCCERIKHVRREDVVSAARMLTPDAVYFLNGTERDDEGEVIP